MRPKLDALLALIVLSAACLGQWSEPISVGDSTGYREGFQLAAGAGDTLWALYETGDSTGMHMVCHWSTGDSWSDATRLATGTYWWWPSAGVDPQGRVWWSWSYGIPWTLSDSFGIYGCVHDSLGWGPPHQLLSYFWICTHNYTADRHGYWYMGIHADCGFSQHYNYTMYSSLRGDSWTEPRILAAGNDSLNYGLPSLVVRPDEGFWAVYSRRIYSTLDWVVVDRIIPPDSQANCRVLYDLAGWTATCDSAGQMWIVYVDTLGAIRSITIDVTTERRRQLVTDNHRWVGPQVCTDAMGWVWAFWARSDTTLVVSCNWGNNWSEPEVVTSKTGYPEDIVSDQHGRVYVGFYDGHGKYWTSYRTSRPGVGSDGDAGRPAVGRGASVVRALPRDFVTFDAMGRRVANPKSGVFFVRDGQDQAVRKVVIQR